MDDTIQTVPTYFLQPGFLFVSQEDYLIQTVLGSCVAVCLWDKKNKMGGMNHYIWNRPFKDERNGKFGSHSIPYLIFMMLEMGSSIADLQAHVIGGAQNPQMHSFVGKDNVEIAEQLLSKRKIKILSRDVGGEVGRKVIFHNTTGEVLIYKIQSIRQADWFSQT